MGNIQFLPGIVLVEPTGYFPVETKLHSSLTIYRRDYSPKFSYSPVNLLIANWPSKLKVGDTWLGNISQLASVV